MTNTELSQIPCPFIYSSGKQCPGHIIRVEAYKADISWRRQEDGSWKFDWEGPRSHFHLFCSLKNNHAGIKGPDALRYFFNQLPEELQAVIDASI